MLYTIKHDLLFGRISQWLELVHGTGKVVGLNLTRPNFLYGIENPLAQNKYHIYITEL